MKGMRRVFKGQKAVKLYVPYLCSADLIPTNPAAPRPQRPLGLLIPSPDTRAALRSGSPHLPGVVLAVVLEVCKLVGVSMFRITLVVLTRLTKVSRYALGRNLGSLEERPGAFCFSLFTHPSWRLPNAFICTGPNSGSQLGQPVFLVTAFQILRSVA